MKKFLFSTAVALTTCLVCGLGLTSCSEDAGDSPASVSTRTTENLPEVISVDKTLYANVTYVLTGKTYVDSAATLTIEPGTRIEGVYNSDPDYASALIVTKGGKIMANGTASAPIIMTAQNGTKGGWGGLVLLGQATVNQGNAGVIEGIDTSITLPSGISVTYGGSNDADNSGVLTYVRVEYAGAAISEANELNAFTFGGVGSGTTVDHCQAYHGADDAFEFFGGTVNCKYLVATANDDDSFDFDFGYTGKIQFAVATIDASLSYSSNPNGIECDNDGSGTSATPKTHPYLSNLTIVGTSNGIVAGGGVGTTHYLKDGAHFRRNCGFTLKNSIIYGFPYAIELQNAATDAYYTFGYNVINGVTSTYTGTTPTGTSITVAASVAAIGLFDAWGGYGDTVALTPDSDPALSGANFTGLDASFFTSTTYKGAFSSTEDAWTSATWVK
jgi:hypothetical protein